MDSINVASVHDTSGYASIRADTFKRGKKMEEVEGTSIEMFDHRREGSTDGLHSKRTPHRERKIVLVIAKGFTSRKI